MACVFRSVKPNTVRQCCLFIQRRHRYKKKWAVNLQSKAPTELALEHFDAFYKPLFTRQWPSIRVSLLSLPKYAAIINNVSDSESSVQFLTELGAIDLIQHGVDSIHRSRSQKTSAAGIEEASDMLEQNLSTGQRNIEAAEVSPEEETNTVREHLSSEVSRSVSETSPAAEVSDEGSTVSDTLENRCLNSSSSDTGIENMKNLLMPDAVKRIATDLEYFMPTEQVFSEKEQLKLEEYSQSMYQERAVSVPVVPGQFPLLPKSLRVMAFPAGDVSDFPKPLADKSGLLNYYLLDAASILPVLALDIRAEDEVLDLCAAPGGKTLALLQILLSQGGHLHSNDASWSRMKRLKTVLRSYVPQDLQQDFVTITEKNGLTFRDPVYNKVLVDVPCNSDRHVLVEEDNNLFKPGRINERLQMTTQQKELLMAGIKSCKPGGTVVYSTCTLAAVQNDGVVQAAVEELWETTDIDVAMEDLTPLKTLLTPFFRFHSGSKLGLLVLPSLLNNYGPTYCCKLKRLQ